MNRLIIHTKGMKYQYVTRNEGEQKLKKNSDNTQEVQVQVQVHFQFRISIGLLKEKYCRHKPTTKA